MRWLVAPVAIAAPTWAKHLYGHAGFFAAVAIVVVFAALAALRVVARDGADARSCDRYRMQRRALRSACEPNPCERRGVSA